MSSILVRGDVSLIQLITNVLKNVSYRSKKGRRSDCIYVVLHIPIYKSMLYHMYSCRLSELNPNPDSKSPGGEYGMPFQWRQGVGWQVMIQLADYVEIITSNVLGSQPWLCWPVRHFCVTNCQWYVPFDVITISPFTHT